MYPQPRQLEDENLVHRLQEQCCMLAGMVHQIRVELAAYRRDLVCSHSSQVSSLTETSQEWQARCINNLYRMCAVPSTEMSSPPQQGHFGPPPSQQMMHVQPTPLADQPPPPPPQFQGMLLPHQPPPHEQQFYPQVFQHPVLKKAM